MRTDMPIGTAIAMLKKEIAEKQAALSVLETLVANGSNAAAQGTGPRPRRGRPTQSVGAAAVDILKATGRPMHGLREILPALLDQGYKIKHRAGLATTLLRTGEIERTAPGTFAVKGGAAS